LEKIDAYLTAKKPVIALVDFSPTAGIQTHFVIIIGKENQSYLINDPWTGETYFFEAKYGDPAKQIFGLRLYSGEVSYEPPLEDQLKDCRAKVEAQGEQILEQSVIIGELEGELEKQEKENTRLAKELVTARSERDTAVGEKKTLEGQMVAFEDKVEVLEGKNKALKEHLGVLEKESIKGLSGWRLIGLGIKKLLERG